MLDVLKVKQRRTLSESVLHVDLTCVCVVDWCTHEIKFILIYSYKFTMIMH